MHKALENLDVIRNIQRYAIWGRVDERKGLYTSILALRLVSNRWKRAVEGCDDIWGIYDRTGVMGTESMHKVPTKCKRFMGGLTCTSTSHYINLNYTRIPFHVLLKRQKARLRMRVGRQIKTNDKKIIALQNAQVSLMQKFEALGGQQALDAAKKPQAKKARARK